MSDRYNETQSQHDNVVLNIGEAYRKRGKYAATNPDGERNEKWSGFYIDVIAKESASSDRAWVIEVETNDSINDTEAERQWKDYDKVYSVWYISVPSESKEKAKQLLRNHNIKNCKVITWKEEDLPGLN